MDLAVSSEYGGLKKLAARLVGFDQLVLHIYYGQIIST